MHNTVCALQGRTLGGYSVETPQARPQNSYICNETHWRALKALQAADRDTSCCALRACFFIHIPSPARTHFESDRDKKAYEEDFCDLACNTDYNHLAQGVA